MWPVLECVGFGVCLYGVITMFLDQRDREHRELLDALKKLNKPTG